MRMRELRVGGNELLLMLYFEGDIADSLDLWLLIAKQGGSRQVLNGYKRNTAMLIFAYLQSSVFYLGQK